MKFTADQDKEFAKTLTELDFDPTVNIPTLEHVSLETRTIGRLTNGNGETVTEAYSHFGAVAYYHVTNNDEYWKPGKSPCR